MKKSMKNLAAIAILAAIYFVAAKLGLRLAFVHPSSTAVWPPAGITLAAFLILGYRVWPGIFLGAFLVNVMTAGSVVTSIGVATGNTLEGLVGAYLVNRFARGPKAFDRAQDIFKFVFFAGIVSTAISATFGVTSLSLGGFASWANFGPVWLTWWLGDAVGDVVVAPFLVVWSRSQRLRWSRGQVVEATALCLILFLVGQAVFGGPFAFRSKNYPLEFLCIPLVIWAAFRFGGREAASAIFMLSGIAIWGTLHGFGPFVTETQNESLIILQAFLAILAVMGLVLAAAVAERKRAADEVSDLYDNAPCGYHSLDAEGTVTHINDTELRWLGFTRDEIIRKKKFGDLLLEGSRKTFEENFSALKGRGWVRDLELRMVRKDGTTLPVLLSATAIRDSVGNFTACRVTVYDITQRLALERAVELEWRATHEMEIARRVQVRLFPQMAPPLETLEYAGACSQARAVGGDYYDFLGLGPGRVGLVVADVSGKALPAALLMASLHATVHSQSPVAQSIDLTETLRSVHRLFYQSTDAETFAALFLGEYDDSNRRLRYANCGLNPPLLVRADGAVEQLTATGPVLGLLQDTERSMAEIELGPGDILVVYTDGIQEASNDAGEEFGVTRLAETVRANRHLPVSSLLTLIATTVQKFGSGHQQDDQTMILARVR